MSLSPDRLPEVQISTTREMFGLPEGTRVLESSMPVTRDPNIGMEQIVHQYESELARWATETVGNPSSEMAIVANPVDRAFVEYTQQMWGRKMEVVPVDLLDFDPTTMKGIMGKLNKIGPVKHYGVYQLNYLNPDQQVLQPDKYQFFNSKGQLSRIVPEEYLPRHVLLVDPQHADIYEDIKTAQPYGTLTQHDLDLLMQGGNFAVVKEASGKFMGGDGVRRVKTVEDIETFRDYLRSQGLADTTLVVEEPMDTQTSGSFSMVRSLNGKVGLLGVTNQVVRPDGLRIGNIIYDQTHATPDTIKLIADIMERVRTNPHSQGIASYIAFDTMRTKNGRLTVNDPAARPTGSTPVAQMRRLIAEQQPDYVNGRDIIAGMAQPRLSPGTDFAKLHQILQDADLTTMNGEKRQVIVRSFYSKDGTKPLAQFALLTDDRERLPDLTSHLAQVLTNAGIFEEWYDK